MGQPQQLSIEDNPSTIEWQLCTRSASTLLLRTCDRMLNCCVEVNGYMPVTFEELQANNARWLAGK